MADKYGAGVNGPFTVVVETNGSPKSAAVISELTPKESLPTRASPVDQPVLSEKKDLAIIGVTPTTAPQDAKPAALLDRLRANVVPGRR